MSSEGITKSEILNLYTQIHYVHSGLSNEYGKNLVAESICTEVARFYWNHIAETTGSSWNFFEYNSSRHCTVILKPEEKALLKEYVSKLLKCEQGIHGYMISDLYASMLDTAYRIANGVFYTPMPIVQRMLDVSEDCGVDFNKAKVVDPSAGGSAFMAPLCRRMINVELFPNHDHVIADIESRLKGYELDPFSAWLSQFLIECELARLVPKARRPKQLVAVRDTIKSTFTSRELSSFDLVIGNPPYGKIQLDEDLKLRYEESLFGHVNVFQLFYHAGFQLAKSDGLVHFLTPTSFLAGEFFKNLRRYILDQSYPLRFEIIKDRLGVFKGVQQEVVASIFQKGISPSSVKVYSSKISDCKESVVFEETGRAVISRKTFKPWHLPRDTRSGDILRRMNGDFCTLAELGFKAITGPFVWNRNKSDLRKVRRRTYLPLIWADSILPSGEFMFKRAANNGRKIWVKNEGHERILISQPGVIIKRTTNKEQKRRIYSAVLPSEFINEHGHVLIENHVNFILAINKNPLKINTLSMILNTKIVDDMFRCMSGTVAVSVAELMNLKLPKIENLLEFQSAIKHEDGSDVVEGLALQLYGL